MSDSSNKENNNNEENDDECPIDKINERINEYSVSKMPKTAAQLGITLGRAAFSFLPMIATRIVRNIVHFPYFIKNSYVGKNYIVDPVLDKRTSVGSSYLSPNMVKKVARAEMDNNNNDLRETEEDKKIKKLEQNEQNELDANNENSSDNNTTQVGGADSIIVQDKGIIKYWLFPGGNDIHLFDEPLSSVLHARTYNQSSIMYEMKVLLNYIKNEQKAKTNFISENFTSIEIIVITLNILDMFEKMSDEIRLSEEIQKETQDILKSFNVKNEGKVQSGGNNSSDSTNIQQNSEFEINNGYDGNDDNIPKHRRRNSKRTTRKKQKGNRPLLSDKNSNKSRHSNTKTKKRQRDETFDETFDETLDSTDPPSSKTKPSRSMGQYMTNKLKSTRNAAYALPGQTQRALKSSWDTAKTLPGQAKKEFISSTMGSNYLPAREQLKEEIKAQKERKQEENASEIISYMNKCKGNEEALEAISRLEELMKRIPDPSAEMNTQLIKQVKDVNWKNAGNDFSDTLKIIPRVYRSFYKIIFGTTNMGFLFSSIYVHLYAIFEVQTSEIDIENFLRKQAWSMLNLDDKDDSRSGNTSSNTKNNDKNNKNETKSKKSNKSSTNSNDEDTLSNNESAVAGDDLFNCFIKPPEDEEVRIKTRIEREMLQGSDAKYAYCLDEEKVLFGIVDKELDIDTFVDRINERTAFYIYLFNELVGDKYLGLKSKLKRNLIKLYRTNNQQFTYRDVPFKFKIKKVKSILNGTNKEKEELKMIYTQLKDEQKNIIMNNYKTIHMTNLYLTDPEKYLERTRYLK